MRLRALVLFYFALLTCASSQSLPTPTFDLMTDQVGWVAGLTRLYWTTNGGLTWTDVTPYTPSSCLTQPDCDPCNETTVGPQYFLSSVFFLNTSAGWAVLGRDNDDYDEDDESSQPVEFSIATTTDAGVTWSIKPLDVPRQWGQIASATRLTFSDARHGWINFSILSNVAFDPGFMLMTDDGGKNWHMPQADPHRGGAIRFVTEKRGWLVGELGELLSTTDGGNSWKEVALNPPSHLKGDFRETYFLPAFSDKNFGYLPVFFEGNEERGSWLQIFTTHNAGRQWKPIATFQSPNESLVERLPARFHGTSIAPFLSNSTINLKRKQTRIISDAYQPGSHSFSKFTFTSRTTGWASDLMPRIGDLWSTSDAGKTWKKITPPVIY